MLARAIDRQYRVHIIMRHVVRARAFEYRTVRKPASFALFCLSSFWSSCLFMVVGLVVVVDASLWLPAMIMATFVLRLFLCLFACLLAGFLFSGTRRTAGCCAN